MNKAKKKEKAERYENKDQESEFMDKIKEVKTVSASTVIKDLMNLTGDAVKLKKRILTDPDEPTWLKLKNADDILDRTVPKPTQNVSFQGAVVQANMTDRELKELLVSRLSKIGVFGG